MNVRCNFCVFVSSIYKCTKNPIIKSITNSFVLVVVVKLLVLEALSVVDVLDNVSEMLVVVPEMLVAELDVLVVLAVAVVVDVVCTWLN